MEWERRTKRVRTGMKAPPLWMWVHSKEETEERGERGEREEFAGGCYSKCLFPKPKTEPAGKNHPGILKTTHYPFGNTRILKSNQKDRSFSFLEHLQPTLYFLSFSHFS